MRLATILALLFISSAKIVGQDFVAELIGPSRWSPTGIVSVACFTLNKETLFVSFGFGSDVQPGAARILRPATSHRSGKAAFDLGNEYALVAPDCGDCLLFDHCDGGYGLASELTLSEEQQESLSAGRYYFSVETISPPGGLLQGQIVPATTLEFTTALIDTNQLSRHESPCRAGFSLTSATLTYSFEITPSPETFSIQLYLSGEPGDPEALLFDFCQELACPERCALQYFTSVPGHLLASLRSGLWQVRFKGIADPDHEYRGQITPLWLDSDQDGVPDYLDFCAETPLGSIVDQHGCSLDQLCPCQGVSMNHGDFVQCMKTETAEFVNLGLMTPDERRDQLRRAVVAECGGKDAR